MQATVRTSARGIIRRGDALLVVQYAAGSHSYYALPGGGQRNGEGLEATLRREVLEETGAIVQVGALRFVRECVAEPGTISLPPDFHAVELFFDCELLTPPSDCVGPDCGQTAVEWRTAAELRTRRFFPAALLDALDERRSFGYLGVV